MTRYALIHPQTGVVENCVLWDGESEWTPGPSHILRAVSDDVGFGDVFDFATETFSRADRVVPVPPVVSRMQALLALDAVGLLDDVEALVASSPRQVQIAWANAPDFHRSSPMIAQLWAALGQTEAGLDDLFRAAGAIQP